MVENRNVFSDAAMLQAVATVYFDRGELLRGVVNLTITPPSSESRVRHALQWALRTWRSE